MNMKATNINNNATPNEEEKQRCIVTSIRNECVNMINELKQLQKKENELKAQNDILAREMIEYGYLDFDVKK